MVIINIFGMIVIGCHHNPTTRYHHRRFISSGIIIARKPSLVQGNIFSSVCQEFCSQGGSASVHAGIPRPPRADTPRSGQPPRGVDTPSGADTPPTRQPPPAQCMLGDTVNKRAVCILLECNLVFNVICDGLSVL